MFLSWDPQSLPGEGFPPSARALIHSLNKGLLGPTMTVQRFLKALNHALSEPTG